MPTKKHDHRPDHRGGRALLGTLALLVSAAMLLCAGCGKAASTTPKADLAFTGSSTTANRSAAPNSLQQVQAQNDATTIDSTSTGSGPIVLFDVSHVEIFGPTNTSDLGQSAAVARMRKAGLRVVAAHTPYTDQMLKGVSAVMIPGNMMPLSKAEVVALASYMQQGGIVLVSVHVSQMDVSIAEPFGIALSDKVLLTTSPRPGDTPEKLICTKIENSRLTQGVKSVRVLGAWAMAAGNTDARMVVGTGPDAYIDMDGNKQLSPSDIRGPFGMIAERQVGKGVLIMSGDDAVFANLALATADNMKLFDNFIAAVKNPK